MLERCSTDLHNNKGVTKTSDMGSTCKPRATNNDLSDILVQLASVRLGKILPQELRCAELLPVKTKSDCSVGLSEKAKGVKKTSLRFSQDDIPKR